MPDENGKKPLSLEHETKTGLVRQSFSHGRTKRVIVEVPKRKFQQKVESEPVADGKPLHIDDAEMERRLAALRAAREEENKESIRKQKEDERRSRTELQPLIQRHGKRIQNYTRAKLNASILRAALTDFKFEELEKKIVAVPFNDLKKYSEHLVDQRINLMEAIAHGIDGALRDIDGSEVNVNDERLIRKLEDYRQECAKPKPNPRILYRTGSIIGAQLLDPEVRVP